MAKAYVVLWTEGSYGTSSAAAPVVSWVKKSSGSWGIGHAALLVQSGTGGSLYLSFYPGGGRDQSSSSSMDSSTVDADGTMSAQISSGVVKLSSRSSSKGVTENSSKVSGNGFRSYMGDAADVEPTYVFEVEITDAAAKAMITHIREVIPTRPYSLLTYNCTTAVEGALLVGGVAVVPMLVCTPGGMVGRLQALMTVTGGCRVSQLEDRARREFARSAMSAPIPTSIGGDIRVAAGSKSSYSSKPGGSSFSKLTSQNRAEADGGTANPVYGHRT